jgi:hypothetical protein
MPNIIMTAGANKLDGAVRGLAFAFLSKLAEDDTLPGLHIEPILHVRDSRVRTGRVNDSFRAVLFKLAGTGEEPSYVYVGTWPHDEAIARAKAATLTINPVNGIPEITATPLEEMAPADATEPQPEAVEAVEPKPKAPVAIQTAEPSGAESLLGARGFSLDDLTLGLGLDEHVAQLALAATTSAELYEVAEQTEVIWQGLAIIELVAGYSIDEIKQRLDLDQPVDVPAKVTDDDILDALRKPAAQLQFAIIGDNEELKRVIDSGDFGAWRTFLHPEQRRYVTARYNGPFRLSGGAGTGKTVVLVHRARELSRQNPAAAILLTTYTTTLAESLRSMLKSLDPAATLAVSMGDPGIYVAGIDAVAARVLRNATDAQRDQAVTGVLGPRVGDLTNNPPSHVWRDVAQSAGGILEPGIANATFLQAEYEMVILPNRVKNRDDYFTVRRPGRGVMLNRAKRDAVWSAFESYRAAGAIAGALNWTERAEVAAALLEANGPLFAHVLVDEGQDLTPSHWKLLRALAFPGPNDLFLAEDSYQRIYGQHVVLSRYGITIVGRSRRLTLNYRTTAENLAYALGILSGADYVDAEGEAESTANYRSARTGPAPQLVAASSLTEELDTARGIVGEWSGRHAAEAIGVLVRDRTKAAQVVTGLSERGLDVRLVEGKVVPPGEPVVMTMHRAKGMEFEAVLILGASDRDLPASYLAKDLAEPDREDFLKRERSLLYVSATRARDELVILWDGEPSGLLPK